jgi:hypothetical protein
MTLMLKAAAFAAFVLTGTHALADESMSRATPTERQMMKDCIEKQKTADVTMSKSQMKRMCHDQLKQQKASGTPAEPPPSDTPKN